MRSTLFIAVYFLAMQGLQAQDYRLYWKYKEYDRAIAFSVPRWATFIGGTFVKEKEDRKLVRKIRKVRVLAFEGESPITQRDVKRFARKAKRRHLDELVTVRTGKTNVMVLAKSRRSTLRKVVVLVNSPDGSALVTMKGKFRLNELNRVIDKYGKERKKQGQPDLPKIPVIRA